MKLQPECRFPDLKSLIGKHIACGQRNGALWNVEPFSMPMIDMARPDNAQRVRETRPFIRGFYGIIANFDRLFGMPRYPGSEHAAEHLCTKAKAQKRCFGLERPIDARHLVDDPWIVIIGAHRPPKHDNPRIRRQIIGETVAQRWTADVERMAHDP